MKEYSEQSNKVTYCKEAELTIKKRDSEFENVVIRTQSQAADFIRKFYHEDIDIYESFFALFLNRRNKTIAYAKISQGGIASVLVDERIIAKYALDTLASGVIVAHNHPSGTVNPSEDDKILTKKIASVLDIINVKLHDHIIITSKNGYYSFADNGEI